MRYEYIIAGEVQEFNISVEVTNGGEDSFGTLLQLRIPTSITYRIAYAWDRNLVIGCDIMIQPVGFVSLSSLLGALYIG